jgi:hypothetical protein
VEAQDIGITDARHDSPGLLRTCRQICNEAFGIFTHENTFCIEIRDLSSRPGPDHWYHTIPDERGAIDFLGMRDWQNLMKWLKRYFDDDKYLFCSMKEAQIQRARMRTV